jgi:hypothetical protein
MTPREALQRIIDEEPHPALFERTAEGREAFIQRLKNIARAGLGLYEACLGHVASEGDPNVCGRCGVHVNELRPEE